MPESVEAAKEYDKLVDALTVEGENNNNNNDNTTNNTPYMTFVKAEKYSDKVKNLRILQQALDKPLLKLQRKGKYYFLKFSKPVFNHSK